LSAIVWGVIAASLHARIVFRMADTSGIAAPGLWNIAMINAGLVGFLIIFILGVTTRAVVGFLALKPTNRWISGIALVLLNVGTGSYVLARYRGESDESAAIGLLLQAAGFVAFVIALRVFEPPSKENTYIEGTYAQYTWFIRGAFVLLLVAAVLITLDAIGMLADDRILSAPLSAPTTHVLTLGFVTMMIMGVGLRMLTLFEGTEALVDGCGICCAEPECAASGGVRVRLTCGCGPIAGAFRRAWPARSCSIRDCAHAFVLGQTAGQLCASCCCGRDATVCAGAGFSFEARYTHWNHTQRCAFEHWGG
jgi:hypothetical protein